MSHLRIHTGGCHDSPAASVSHAAAGINHIGPISQRSVFLYLKRSVLFTGNRFPCKRGFLRFQAGRFYQSGIGRYIITGFHKNNIPRHHLHGIDYHFLAVTDNPGMRRRHALKGLHGLFRLTFLHHSHDGVENNNKQNQKRFKKFRCFMSVARHNKRNDSRSDQNKYHHILKLLKKTLQIRFLFLSPQLVRAIFPETFLCPGACQPFCPAAL